MSRRDYGEGSVYQRTDGRWAGVLEAGYTERGTRRRITVTAKTEAAAKRKLRDRRVEIAAASGRASSAEQARKTVKAWADEWLEIRRQTKRPNTYLADRGNVRNWIVPTIGHKRIAELTAADDRAIGQRIRAAGHGTPTVLRTQRTLARMLRDGLKDGYPVPQVMLELDGVELPKSDRQALELPQAVAVLGHAVDLPHGVRWYLGFFQGLRQGEALGLTWEAIDFEAGTIMTAWQLQPLSYNVPRDRTSGFRIPHDYEARRLEGRFHLTRPKTKAGARVIPMVEPIRDALLHYRETWAPNPHGLLFTRANGWPIDAKGDAAEFHALQAAANVRHPKGRPYTVHEIRNSTATILGELGTPDHIVTAILGHTSVKTSQGYMNARSAPMMAAMEGIAAAFAPKAIEG